MANRMLEEVNGAFNSKKLHATGSKIQLPDIIMSTGSCLALTVIGAVLGFLFFPPSLILYVGLMAGLLFFGIILARKSPVSALAALTYSGALGLLVGAFTNSATYQGGAFELVSQALVGTVAGVAAVLIVYSTKFGVKAARATKFFAIAALGYFIVAILSFGSSLLGFTGSWGFYGQGTLGILLCLIGVTLASWSLLVNIDFSQNLVNSAADTSWKWSAGMSVSSSIAWMYIEILRLLSIVNR